MIAAVGTVAGVFLVDVEAEELLGEGNEVPATEKPEVALPRVVAAARSGATVVAVVERRPPLMLSTVLTALLTDSSLVTSSRAIDIPSWRRCSILVISLAVAITAWPFQTAL